MDPLKEDLQEWLKASVHIAYRDNQYLWQLGLSERSKVAQIFLSLRSLVPQEWHVDNEYNRHGWTTKKVFVDNRETWGTPDILIHQRGNDDHNLLVAEFKPDSVNQEPNSRDQQKVQYWCDYLGYQLGAVVGLPGDGASFHPTVTWISDGKLSESQPL